MACVCVKNVAEGVELVDAHEVGDGLPAPPAAGLNWASRCPAVESCCSTPIAAKRTKVKLNARNRQHRPAAHGMPVSMQ
jgi:hypothetical protein